MSTAGGPVRQPFAWLDGAVLAGSVVTGAACALTIPSTAAIAVGALAVVGAAWVVFGRRTDNGGRGWWAMLAIVVLACWVGASANPTFAIFQVVAFPLAWMITPRFREGFAANVLTAAAIAAGYARTTGPLEAVAVEGVSFGFSVAMGAWISRIILQSDERQALVDRLTAAQAEVAALNRETGAVAERERLARELHDTLAQSLAGVVMLAERARGRHPADPGLGVLEDAARQALGEARALVVDGANVPLEGGLAAALATLAERARRETGLAVSLDVRAEVPRGLEVVLLRCAQEGLANVRKHARATAVSLLVDESDRAVRLTVTDDGDGPRDGSGFGIAGMRDRLALVGGAVELTRSPSGGAVLTVRVPVPAEVPS